MPQLDLREALLDPLLIDRFQVVRRAETVNNYGRSTTKNLYFNTFGVVDSASPNDLQRLGDYQFQGGAISVVCQFKLRGVSQEARQNYQPDLIQWDSATYIVVTVENYSRYGAGWIQAIAVETTPFVSEAPGPDGYIPSLTFTDPRNSGYLPCFS